MIIQPVVEDIVHEEIIKKAFQTFRRDLILYNALGKSGSGYIKKRIQGFNEASRPDYRHFILIDLDQTQCAPKLCSQILPNKLSSNLYFNIAVREAEAWLMADRDNFSTFFKVPRSRLPNQPDGTEQIQNPKEFLFGLVSLSRSREIKEDILPKGSSKQGPAYNARMTEFIINYWSIDNACRNSSSLLRFVHKIQFIQ